MKKTALLHSLSNILYDRSLNINFQKIDLNLPVSSSNLPICDFAFGNYETKIYKYIGETNHSNFDRGAEHLEDMRTIKSSSHLLKHVLDKHEGETLDEVDFRMRVVKFHKAAFKRICPNPGQQAPFPFEF